MLQLPTIKNTITSEVLDVSSGYIFYDQTQPDSTLLNRKNLISTTNWLVNVDKRLTLRQAIPHIKYLQDKKRNAKMHKNENAKNFFTCNDTSIGNLGFLEFTDVNYEIIDIVKDSIAIHASQRIGYNDIVISQNPSPTTYFVITNTNKEDFENQAHQILELLEKNIPLSEGLKINGLSIDLYFEENLSFQDYIRIKSKLSELISKTVRISTNEFIY
ncbi:hypothetical protein [Winogradskyella sp. PE311]|uniref:hypothetical protein n=1 Tax=Winogradskyella sp. PE311 TaxID=3366943 RepID=UPI00397EA15C